MAISFNTIPSNQRAPGVFSEIDNSRAALGLLQQNWRGLLVAAVPATVGKAHKNTAVLNDATASGTYTGTNASYYEVVIDGTGTPDTFKWRKRGGSWTSTVAITGSAQSLAEGVSVAFAATTGHTAGDAWLIPVTPVTATNGTLYNITDSNRARALWGESSLCAHMAETFRANNAFTELWGVSVADPAGAAATATLAITAVATVASTLKIYVNGELIQVATVVGETATQLADKIVAEYNSNPGRLCIAHRTAAGTVTFSFKHIGVVGNEGDLRLLYYATDRLPTGFAATVTDFATAATGSGDHVLTSVVTAMGDQGYEFFVTPFTDSTSYAALKTEFERRWAGTVQKLTALWSAKRGSLSDLSTFGNAKNSEFMTIMGDYNSPTPSWERAAAYGAIGAYYLSIDPARPLQTLILQGVKAAPEADRWTNGEANTLLFDGVATSMAGADGTVRVQREITTYQTNPYGGSDVSYLDIQTPYTMQYLREDLNTALQNAFPRYKLASDTTEVSPGQAIVRPKDLKAFIAARATLWEQAGLIEDSDTFIDGMVVERNLQDVNRVDVLLPPNIVNQLRVIAVKWQFVL